MDMEAGFFLPHVEDDHHELLYSPYLLLNQPPGKCDLPPHAIPASNDFWTALSTSGVKTAAERVRRGEKKPPLPSLR